MTTLAEIHIAITAGVADDNLVALQDAIKTRKDILVSLRALEFKPGVKVRVVNIRPKYLSGLEGVIERQDNKKWVVKLNDADAFTAGSYLSPSGTMTLHEACVEVIVDA